MKFNVGTQDLLDLEHKWSTAEVGVDYANANTFLEERDVLIVRCLIALIERIDYLAITIRDGFKGDNY